MIDIISRNVSLLIYLIFLFYFFSNWRTQTSKKKKYHKPIWLLILFLTLVTSPLSDFLLKENQLPYINIVIACFLIYSVAKINNIRSLDALIWTIILVVTNLTCEVLSFSLLRLFFDPHMISYKQPSFAISAISIDLLLGLVAIILFKQIIIKKQTTHLNTQIRTLFFLIAVPILSIAILFGLLMGIQSEKNYGNTEVIMTVSVIILNVCVFFLYKTTIEHQNELYQLSLSKQSLEMEYKLMDEMKKNLSTVTKLKHDLKNQYLVVLGLLANSEKEKAENYIKETLNILEPPTKVYAPDSVLNYLLTEKMTYALENRISVNHHIFISKNLRLDSEVLTIIIANILDNAIEASLRMDTNNRSLNVMMKQSKNDLFIEVSNRFNVTELETRRARQEKGLGMKNIDSLIRKMGGIYKHWHKNDIYYVTIVLFNGYKN